MKCVIPGINCKILGRAIHALAKISEEMYVEPREKSLSFRSVSPSNSAYCDFTFQDLYFSSYSSGDLDEEDALKCKISMKSAMAVFKSLPVIEKSVDSCHIRLQPNADQLIFLLHFKNGVVKTFFLPIIDCEQLSAPLTKDNLPNKLSAKSRILTDVIQNFQQNVVEITLEVTPQKLLMRNYVDDNSTVANSTRTQLAVTIGEFDAYAISLETQITFCLKEFKAILGFAEAVALPLNLYFETAGKPAFFELKHVSFEANLVLSTLNSDSADASILATHEMRQSIRKRATTKKTPRQVAKSSRRKLANKSIVSNKSGSIQTNTTAVGSRSKSPNASTRMDVDEASTAGSSWRTATNSAPLDNADVPETPEVSESQGSAGSNAERRSAAASTPSNRLTIASPNLSPLVSSLNAASHRSNRSHRATEPSIFSPNWKERADRKRAENPDEPMDEDEVPGSPPRPAKKAKIIFKKCFQATFDPRMLPGHDTILAYDSDEGK